ncbi:MAG TPA: copper resistance CopC family protein [Pseudonocardiaceae bacterium]|jgi:methionine-rich copper-binding protein CopC|nr:copper resistance CopC family protein [Pseudonocardiaceae bacterium]
MRRAWISLGLAGVAVAALATPAAAHDVLVGSYPRADASVSTSPTEVRFDFDAPVKFGDDTVVVLGPNNTHWERTQRATVTGNSVSVPLAPLGPAGVYTASYHIISADGHPVTGDIRFTLTKAGNGSPVTSATAAGTTSGGDGGVPVWVWILVAVVVLAAALFFALRPGTRKSQENGE